MTVGNPLRLLTVFSIPMLIGNLFQQLYSLVDSIVVGRFVGADALASVGSTGSITFLFFSVCNGISAGCGVVTSQYFGARDDAHVKKSIANSAYIMFVSSVIMAIAAFLAAPAILRFIGTPEEILDNAILYMRMNCAGVPLVAVYNYSGSMERALGDSTTPLHFLIFSCFLNIVLDLFCVCILDLSVFGAALATIIAQLVAGAGCLLFALRHNLYFKLTREDFAPDKTVIKKSVKIGLPLAVQWSMIAVSSTAVQTFVNTFGTSAEAAFTATNRIEQLVHQPYGSYGSALSTYAGQNYGAGKNERVREGVKQGIWLSAAFSVLMLAVNYLFGGPIVSLFVDDAEVIAIGTKALRITGWFYLFLGIINMTRGALNGVGDAMFSFINGIVEMIVRILLPMLFALMPLVGVWGIWWTSGLSWLISAFFCVLRYLSWIKKHGGKDEKDPV